MARISRCIIEISGLTASRREMGGRAHLCALSGGAANSTPPRSDDHNHHSRKRMLSTSSVQDRQIKQDQRTLLARMAVYVRLQRARPGEALVTNLAFMFLLRAG